MSAQEEIDYKSEKKDGTISTSRLSREEREDLIHSLEHIVTVGSSIRRNVKRRKGWEAKHQSGRETNATILIESNAEKGASRPSQRPALMHAEDVRIYGKRGRRQRNWPTKHRVKRKDNEWDIDYGDCIHPLAFLEARLSDIPPTKRQRIDGRNLSQDKTDCTVALEEVPRAMIAHCWERAVHAASVGLDCTESLSQQADGAPSLPSSADEAKDFQFSPEKAVQKCRDLGIELKSIIGDLSCPTCGIDFDSNDDLGKHFYGRTKPSQRGCCWKKIRTTQYELLDQVLQHEVRGAADGAVKSVMLSLDRSTRQTEPAGSEASKVRNWQDVLNILESTCESARVENPSANGLLETMQYEPRKGSIVLNPHVLKNSRQRLSDRYADMPL